MHDRKRIMNDYAEGVIALPVDLGHWRSFLNDYLGTTGAT
jgi:hypothetical protein